MAQSAPDAATLLSRRRLTAAAAPEGVAPGAAEPLPGDLIRVRYAARGADVGDVIRVLLREHLGRDYILDPKVTGQVTLDIDDEFTSGELLDIVGLIASMNGWFIEQRGQTIVVRPADRLPKSAAAPVLLARPAAEDESPAVRIRRLRFLAPDAAMNLLKDMVSEGGRVAAAGRTLVIAETTRQIARLSRLLGALDVPAFEGAEVWTYRLAYRRPEDAEKLLKALAEGSGMASGTDPSVVFVALPGTSRLMVIARDPSLQGPAQELIREVDSPAEGEARRRFVYRIQNYQSQALLKLLTDFFGGRLEVVGTGAGAGPNAPGPAAAASDDGRIRLAVDPQNDLLLIHATPTDFAEVLATLRAVDRPPQQVLIQSIIAEVRLEKRLEYGVEYFLEMNLGNLGELGLTAATPLINPALATGTAFFVAADGFVIIRALDRESGARILSQPRLVIQDRAKGSIQVGGEVPTIKATEGGSTQQGGTTNILQEIEYRKTGVILTIQPQINESGEITLAITQEVTAAVPTTIPNQPEFTTRRIETTVVVPHGRTVLLGGIINEARRTTDNRVPLLGRIPIVGAAFKNHEGTKERTELLLALTPRVINEPYEAEALTSSFLNAAYGVRAALDATSPDLPTGSLYVPPPGTPIWNAPQFTPLWWWGFPWPPPLPPEGVESGR